jgi:hypothetical protein
LAYAPARTRLPTLALFALDARLAGLLRNSREPMLAQLRFSWWRETLDREADEWPSGEPLLAALGSWQGEHRSLRKLVDGWEALTGNAPLSSGAIEEMAAGRAAAFGALAATLGLGREAEAAEVLGREWAFADLAMKLGDQRERDVAAGLARATLRRRARVSRSLRPLLVLHGLAVHRMEKGGYADGLPPSAVGKALRLGIFGR